MTPTRNALYLVAAIVLAGGALACGSAKPTSAPAAADGNASAPAATQKAGPTTVAAGTAVDITTGSGDKLTVTVASPQAKVPSGNQFITPKKGQFFVITATVAFNTGTATYYANEGDFKLVTSDGTVYKSEFLTTIEPTFTATQLNAGQKVTGKIAFDVPATVAVGSGAKIQFDGSWDGKAAAFWTI